jgi:hypothetical protein
MTNLFCNWQYDEDITEFSSAMHLQSNGGCMSTKKKGTVLGYNTRVWFSSHAITNIAALKVIAKQYPVT